MSKCVVNGCQSRRKQFKDSNHQHISMHGFPKSTSQIKLWLQQTGQDFGDIDAFAERVKEKNRYYRICSTHFSEDSYYMHGFQKLLKPDAIPTIFKNKAPSSQRNETHANLPSTSATNLPGMPLDYLPCNVVKIEKEETFDYPPPGVFMDYGSISQAPVLRHISTNTQEVRTHDRGITVRPTFGVRSMKTQTGLSWNKKNASTSTNVFLKKDAFMWTGLNPTLVDRGTQTDGVFDWCYLLHRSDIGTPLRDHSYSVARRQNFLSSRNVSIQEEDSKPLAEFEYVIEATIEDSEQSSEEDSEVETAKDDEKCLRKDPDYIPKTNPESSPESAPKKYSYLTRLRTDVSSVQDSDIDDTDHSSDEDFEIENAIQAVPSQIKKQCYNIEKTDNKFREQSPIPEQDGTSSNDRQEKNHSYFTRRKKSPCSVPSSHEEETKHYSEVYSEMEDTIKKIKAPLRSPDYSPNAMDPLKEQPPIIDVDYSQEIMDCLLKVQSSLKNADYSQETMEYRLKEQSPVKEADSSKDIMDYSLKKESALKSADYNVESMDCTLKELSPITNPDYIVEISDYILEEESPTNDAEYSQETMKNPLKEEFPIKDSNDKPETTANTFRELSSVNDPTKEGLVHERKYIVFESCLDALFVKLECSYSDQCKEHILKFQKNVVGTLLIVYGECASGHRSKLWQSQPMIGQMATGDLLSSAAVLFSGNQITKVSEMFNFIGVPFISEKTFSVHQKKIIFPIIDLHWKNDRQTTISSLKDKSLSLIGDGQYNNPAFCTYALLEDTTKKIIDFCTVQDKISSSVTTESKAFRRCLNNVISEGLLVHMLATDLCGNIQKIMCKEYNFISHQFEVWNYSDRIHKKLRALAKKKTCKAIKPWIPSILSHLWASSSECHSNLEMLKETWRSILYHISNTHVWDDGILINGCKHEELPKEDCEERPWDTENTMAYSALEELICDLKIQKDMQYLTEYCHAAEIDKFHTMVLKYLPKCMWFRLDAIQARTKLAILAHNNNVNEATLRTVPLSELSGPSGNLRSKTCLPNSRKRCHTESGYQYTFEFVFPMLTDVLDKAPGEISQIRSVPGPNLAPKLQPSCDFGNVILHKRPCLDVCSM